MQKIMIRELQHNLAAVLKMVKSGQDVMIFNRKTPVARLLPADYRDRADWEDHEREIMEIFHGRTLQSQTPAGIISETRHEF
ncbi:MAG: type II toxin-antitoxin system prevent-host-death family antitoxin [Spirochaetales bacterium]|nr:type II toxin-antitoxin system prevent-host-death family antitoxin [Spirochaetales bacterium]